MAKWIFGLLVSMIILPGLILADDIPYVFDDRSSNLAGTAYSLDQMEKIRAESPDLAGIPSLSSPQDDDVLEFPVTGGGNAPNDKTERKVADLKLAFDSRVEPENPKVRTEAVALVARYPGDYTIDQISLIYTHLKDGWRYVRDPRGIDYYMYANETLKVGEKASCVGAGDCDDFAILMAALVESVGGTTRIVLAHNNSTGGHSFAEVYLGQLNGEGSRVTEVIDWLKTNFNIDKIYTNVDTDTKDVWLNLDWGADEKGNMHPGGPFYHGDKYVVLCIRDDYGKTPLNLPEGMQSSIAPQETEIIANSPQQYSQIKSNAVSSSPVSISLDGAIPPGAGPIDWYMNRNG